MADKMVVTELTEEQARAEMKRKMEANPIPHVNAEACSEVLEPKTEEESVSFIQKCIGFVKDGGFKAKVSEISERTGMPERKVAKNFLQKVLGAIGDGAELTGNTVEDLCKTFLNVLHFILQKAVEIIVKAAKFIFRLLTFNYTCVTA